MNEVEKMYKNVGIKPLCQISDKYCGMKNVYEDFTAEKQIHIIKWLSDKADYIDIHYDQYKGLFIIQTGIGGLYVCNEFEQALASRVNIIWKDLSEEQRKQIKEILE